MGTYKNGLRRTQDGSVAAIQSLLPTPERGRAGIAQPRNPQEVDRFRPMAQIPDAVAPPQGNPRFPAVDALRAAAALAVVLFHADQFSAAQNTIVGRAVAHLDVGVAVFFAITGFLLYRPYFAAAVGDAPRTPTRVFYWRRALRIIPGYWVALIALAPILVFAHPPIVNFFFLQIYRPAWDRSGIGPAWSVCVEMSFYVLLPLFARRLNRAWGHLDRHTRREREIALFVGLAVASTILRALIHRYVHHVLAVDPLPTTLPWFCIGIALAIISVDAGRYSGNVRAVMEQHPWWSWAAALAIYATTLTTAAIPDTDGSGVLLFIRYGLIAGLILGPLVLGAPARFVGGRVALAGPAAWLGLVSYGIYLYHYPLMKVIHPHTGSRTADLLVLAAAGTSIAVSCGALSYYAIERRVLTLKRIHEFPALQRALRL